MGPEFVIWYEVQKGLQDFSTECECLYTDSKLQNSAAS